jgi:hypothetical protein
MVQVIVTEVYILKYFFCWVLRLEPEPSEPELHRNSAPAQLTKMNQLLAAPSLSKLFNDSHKLLISSIRRSGTASFFMQLRLRNTASTCIILPHLATAQVVQKPHQAGDAVNRKPQRFSTTAFHIRFSASAFSFDSYNY